MKLAHPELECQLTFNRNRIFEWVIESPELFAKHTQELYMQSYGQEGDFVLSEENEMLPIDMAMETIVNPFTVNINNKKILNRLYTELDKYANDEEMYLHTQETISALHNYCAILEQHSPFMLEEQADIEVSSVFRILGIKLANDTDGFFDNVLEYIKTASSLMDKRIFVFINLKSYIRAGDMIELYKAAQYNEVNILLIDNVDKILLKESNHCIIDKDGCEIYP